MIEKPTVCSLSAACCGQPVVAMMLAAGRLEVSALLFYPKLLFMHRLTKELTALLVSTLVM